MRHSRRGDIWRRVNEERNFGLRSVSARGVESLRRLDDELPKGLLVLCGLNGAGKTTLFRAIAETLCPDSTPGIRQTIVTDGRFTLGLAGAPTTELLLDDNDSGVRVVYIDVASECWKLLELLDEPNFQDLVDQVGAQTWSDKELQMASWAVGRRYDSIKVFEVEAPEDEEDGVFGYFEVCTLGSTYTSEHMGLGELACLTALWRIWRIEAESIVFIEEPETYLSSRSSAALVDVLAEVIGKRRSYAVLTTHSATVIESVPVESLRIVERFEDGSRLRSVDSKLEAQRHLGLKSMGSNILLTEDKAAAAMLRELLGFVGSPVPFLARILSAGGESNVVEVVRRFPQSEVAIVVGVLDGDQTLDPEIEMLCKLPGDGCPEELMKFAVLESPELYSDLVGRPEDDVRAALVHADAVDIHEFFHELHASLDVSLEFCFQAAIRVWLECPDNQDQARGLGAEILSLFGLEGE